MRSTNAADSVTDTKELCLLPTALRLPLRLAALLFAAPALATTADDLCAPTADPCVVSGTKTITSGSIIDVGSRRLSVIGTLDVGSGSMTLRSGELRVENSGKLQGRGTLSLPGGAIDTGESVHAAALREAEEEIGVPADRVRLLGSLSTVWVSVSNFVIHPVIGIMDGIPEFRLHEREVEGLIETPVSLIRDPSRLHWTSLLRSGTTVEFPYFDVAGHTVWGATAIVLGEFACLFDANHAPRALD